jgi:ankyrin repeat protein
MAARFGENTTGKLLLDEGAEIGNYRYHAVCAKKKTIAEKLIERNAILNCSDDCEITSLHCAVNKGEKEILTLLLERGADTNIENVGYQAALHLAVEGAHETDVRLLAEFNLQR